MRSFLKILTWGGIIVSSLGLIFVAGFLQEFHGDEIKDQSGVTLPLQKPRIEVSIQRMTLSLYDADKLVKRYSIGYGRGPMGRTVNRKGGTPYGTYSVIDKQKHKDILSRGSRFLVLDFPSADDAEQAYDVDGITEEEYDRIMAAAATGDPPPSDTALGGPIGIHGNFFFFMERRFTDGSIALSNGDLNELYEYVPIGTPVTIDR